MLILVIYMLRSTTQKRLKWHTISLPVANKGKSKVILIEDVVVFIVGVVVLA